MVSRGRPRRCASTPGRRVNTSRGGGSWGRLAAASGWIGVPFEHRNSRACTALPEVASDLDDLIAFVCTQIPEVDPDRLIVWVCSGGGVYGLRAAIRHADYVRCAVVYYAFLEPTFRMSA
jgi:hypothetical protein